MHTYQCHDCTGTQNNAPKGVCIHCGSDRIWPTSWTVSSVVTRRHGTMDFAAWRNFIARPRADLRIVHQSLLGGPHE